MQLKAPTPLGESKEEQIERESRRPIDVVLESKKSSDIKKVDFGKNLENILVKFLDFLDSLTSKYVDVTKNVVESIHDEQPIVQGSYDPKQEEELVQQPEDISLPKPEENPSQTPLKKPAQLTKKKKPLPKGLLKIITFFSKVLLKIKTFFSKVPKKQLTYIFALGIPLILLFILALSIMMYIKAEPYNVASKFLKLVEQREIEQAYLLTTPTYQIVVSEVEFKEIVKKLNSVDISNAKLRKRSVKTIEGMGTYAYVTYKVSGYNLELVIFNAQRDWGVHSIELVTR